MERPCEVESGAWKAGREKVQSEVAIRAMERTTDRRMSFRFSNLLLQEEISMNQWRQWLWSLAPQLGSSGCEGAAWEMALRSVKFGNADFITLSEPPHWPTTQSWTSVPHGLPQGLGS